MALHATGRSLYDSKSPRELLSAIAHAIGAADTAWFTHHTLHRDVSVANIVITNEGAGRLIDWDLQIRLPEQVEDQAVEWTVARSIARKGTWQFMSSRLLKKRNAFRDYCDDRESALWVLLWVALQYTATHHGGRPFSGSGRDLSARMTMFNEIDACMDGGVSGGGHKTYFLLGYFRKGTMSTDHPVMDSLVDTLTATFDIRYTIKPTAEDIETLENVRTDMPEGPKKERVIQTLHVIRYQQRMDKLQSEGWLVNTIREHLAMLGSSTEDDKSCCQIMQTPTSINAVAHESR